MSVGMIGAGEWRSAELGRQSDILERGEVQNMKRRLTPVTGVVLLCATTTVEPMADRADSAMRKYMASMQGYGSESSWSRSLNRYLTVTGGRRRIQVLMIER